MLEEERFLTVLLPLSEVSRAGNTPLHTTYTPLMSSFDNEIYKLCPKAKSLKPHASPGQKKRPNGRTHHLRAERDQGLPPF